MTAEEWAAVFSLAERHHLLPVTTDYVHRSGAEIPPEVFDPYRRRSRRLVYIQTAKTDAFLSLYKALADRGVAPLVLKGIICRTLYPDPDFRLSADEDLLLPRSEAETLHQALTERSLRTDTPPDKLSSADEAAYSSADGKLLLEVHFRPFPGDSDVFSEYNSFFRDVFDNAEILMVGGVPLRAPAPTDHLFYLLCHALRHFLHGGFGIRQVCDICLFACARGGEIDWQRLIRQAEAVRALDFTAALFSLGERFLGFDIPSSGFPQELLSGAADAADLLEDLLDSGVYGASTLSRKHSSSITLGAVENEKRGAPPERPPVRRILFPPAAALSGRYPYLKKRPWLLPAAWMQRLAGYLGKQTKSDSASDALRIGKKRLSLLREYGILEGKSPPPRTVDTAEYIEMLRGLLEESNEVSLPVTGGSMTPFLGDGRDQVFLRKPDRPLRRGDVALYRRDNGDYVLHRIHRVHDGGESFDMAGDAQSRIERGIRDDQIVAVVTRARRKGEIIEPGSFYWWFFQNVWIGMVPLRRPVLGLYNGIRRRNITKKGKNNL